MTRREKVLIAITVVATGASVCMFAFVSLAHFLKTTPQHAPPLVSKLYQNSVTQLATLEPVPVAAAAAAPTKPDDSQKKVEPKKTAQKSRKHTSSQQSLSDPQVSRKIWSKLVKDQKLDPKAIVKVLEDANVDANTIKQFKLLNGLDI